MAGALRRAMPASRNSFIMSDGQNSKISCRSEEHTSEIQSPCKLVCRFFNDTATTEIYTLSLHDALPICMAGALRRGMPASRNSFIMSDGQNSKISCRSEEHTSELQSPCNLVCRLLL